MGALCTKAVEPEPTPPSKPIKRRGSVSSESVKPSEIDKTQIKMVEKSEEATKRIRASIVGGGSSGLLFRALDAEAIDAIVGSMSEVKVAKDEYIIKQGDEGNHFYVVDSGSFDCFVKPKDSDEAFPGGKVCSYGQATAFGELALMYNQPRAASVMALEDSVLWSVERMVFRMLILDSAAKAGMGKY